MRVAQTLILLPVLAQVLLTFMVLIAMGIARRKSLASKGLGIEDVALATDADWDIQARKCSNNYKNQFELPVLFYVVCVFAFAARMVDTWMLALAVAFVLTRYAHTFVHLTSNRVLWRGIHFLIGFGLLAAMWVLLLARIAATGF